MPSAEVNELGRHYIVISDGRCRRRLEIRTARPRGRAVSLL